MPVMVAQPVLHKPKSMLRLRLGLNENKSTPSSATGYTKAKSEVETTPSLSEEDHYASLAQLAAKTATSVLDTTVTSIEPSPSASSALSRPDSRSLFTYDTSPPSTTDLEADTSLASYTSSDLHAQSDENLTRATLGHSTTHKPHKHDYYLAQPDSYVAHAETESYPHIRKAASSSDDIYNMTDLALLDRFKFGPEIGFGNWGSVWTARTRKVRFSMEGDATFMLGRKSALSSGSRGGGQVAIKLVAMTDTTEPPEVS